jgi:hypothetical protein
MQSGRAPRALPTIRSTLGSLPCTEKMRARQARALEGFKTMGMAIFFFLCSEATATADV